MGCVYTLHVGCAGRAVINASCAELQEDMLYVDFGVNETEPSMLGGGFFWSPGAGKLWVQRLVRKKRSKSFHVSTGDLRCVFSV